MQVSSSDACESRSSCQLPCGMFVQWLKHVGETGLKLANENSTKWKRIEGIVKVMNFIGLKVLA